MEITQELDSDLTHTLWERARSHLRGKKFGCVSKDGWFVEMTITGECLVIYANRNDEPEQISVGAVGFSGQGTFRDEGLWMRFLDWFVPQEQRSLAVAS